MVRQAGYRAALPALWAELQAQLLMAACRSETAGSDALACAHLAAVAADSSVRPVVVAGKLAVLAQAVPALGACLRLWEILPPLEASRVLTEPCTPDAVRSAAQSFAVAARLARLVWPPWLSGAGPLVQLAGVASPLTALVLIAQSAQQSMPQVASGPLEPEELVLPPAEAAEGPVL
jgi:hypothetical protein